MPTATILLNITSFVPNGCCEIDRPTIQPTDGGHRVAHKSENPDDPHYHTLVVKSRGKAPLKLSFTVTPGGEYLAKGITFQQKKGEGDPAGKANFKDHLPEGGTLTLTNVFAHSGHGHDNPHWEYTIAVTQVSTGLPGSIDPGIENTEEQN